MDHSEDESNDDVFRNLLLFLRKGCGCCSGPEGSQCSLQFSEPAVELNLRNMLELTSSELDLVILANIQVFSRNEVSGGKRVRSSRCNFTYQTKSICKDMFLRLYGISYSRFLRLREHYEINGVCPRQHGNTKRLPWNKLSQSTLEDVKTFIANYVEENAIVLPGRIPGFKNDDIKLLPSNDSKSSVWQDYSRACEASDKTPVSYRTFVNLWAQFYPDVVIAKPRTDLCPTCQDSSTKLQSAANSDEEKAECLRQHQEHLQLARSEREQYKEVRRKAMEALDSRPDDTAAWKGPMHYSFDYAQGVHIPSNPMQPGPIYFKTPRKVSIFGVMDEAGQQQVNFLIDEAVDTGKGANSTISYVHYFLDHYGHGETDAHLNADNCSGQGKNNYFIWYLAWRILSHLNHNLNYSFLIAGHTKFSPDRCFGMVKKLFKTTFVSSIYDLGRVVEKSSSVGVNRAQLVGTHDGRVLVHVHDWASFLAPYFRKVPGIKKFHHFRFCREQPGVVFCKEFISSEEQRFMLLKKHSVLPPRTLPQVLAPQGLSHERKEYLYREIRQFCREGTEDLVAPLP